MKKLTISCPAPLAAFSSDSCFPPYNQFPLLNLVSLANYKNTKKKSNQIETLFQVLFE
jgi:hypothetical protein